jgi:hypothetical protein
LKDHFTIECGADGYARGTVYAFDSFFDTNVTDVLSDSCPDRDSFAHTGTRLDFAIPCPIYCPPPPPANWSTLNIDSLLFATPSIVNGNPVLSMPCGVETATTVDLPPQATNLKIDFDLYEMTTGVGELFVSVGHNLLALEQFRSETLDGPNSFFLTQLALDTIRVTITSTSATLNHVTIDISSIDLYANNNRLNVGFLMEDMAIAIGNMTLTAW